MGEKEISRHDDLYACHSERWYGRIKPFGYNVMCESKIGEGFNGLMATGLQNDPLHQLHFRP